MDLTRWQAEHSSGASPNSFTKPWDRSLFQADSNWHELTLALRPNAPELDIDTIASTSTPRAYFEWHNVDGETRSETTHRIYSTTDRLEELSETMKLRALCVWLAAQLPDEALDETVEYLRSAAESYQLAHIVDQYSPRESRLPSGGVRTEQSIFFGYPDE